jgi:hypothetical protein
VVNGRDRTGIEAPPPPIYLLPLLFGVALASELFVGLPLVPYGLEMPAEYLLPLVLVVASLFAAIGASWAGTLLGPGRTRTRLLPVVGVSVATAAVVALMAAVIAVLGPLVMSQAIVTEYRVVLEILVPLAGLLVVIAVPISAGWAAWRFRGPRGRMGRGALLTLALAVVVFCATLLPELVGSLFAIFGVLPENAQNYLFSYETFDILGVRATNWVAIAGLILGLALAVWRIRRPADRLGTDAAITLGLVGLGPLIIAVTSYVLEALGVLP